MAAQEFFDIINGDEALLTESGRKLVGGLLIAAAEHDNSEDGRRLVETLTQRADTKADLLMLQMIQYKRVFDKDDISTAN